MCPICGHSYVIGTDMHAGCRDEAQERAKDLLFIRSLRTELDQRGIDHVDFLAQLMLVVEDYRLQEGLLAG